MKGEKPTDMERRERSRRRKGESFPVQHIHGKVCTFLSKLTPEEVLTIVSGSPDPDTAGKLNLLKEELTSETVKAVMEYITKKINKMAELPPEKREEESESSSSRSRERRKAKETVAETDAADSHQHNTFNQSLLKKINRLYQKLKVFDSLGDNEKIKKVKAKAQKIRASLTCTKTKKRRAEKTSPESSELQSEAEEPEAPDLQPEASEPEAPDLQPEASEPEAPDLQPEASEPEAPDLQPEASEPEASDLQSEAEEPEASDLQPEAEEPHPDDAVLKRAIRKLKSCAPHLKFETGKFKTGVRIIEECISNLKSLRAKRTAESEDGETQQEEEQEKPKDKYAKMFVRNIRSAEKKLKLCAAKIKDCITNNKNHSQKVKMEAAVAHEEFENALKLLAEAIAILKDTRTKTGARRLKAYTKNIKACTKELNSYAAKKKKDEESEPEVDSCIQHMRLGTKKLKSCAQSIKVGAKNVKKSTIQRLSCRTDEESEPEDPETILQKANIEPAAVEVNSCVQHMRLGKERLKSCAQNMKVGAKNLKKSTIQRLSCRTDEESEPEDPETILQKSNIEPAAVEVNSCVQHMRLGKERLKSCAQNMKVGAKNLKKSTIQRLSCRTDEESEPEEAIGSSQQEFDERSIASEASLAYKPFVPLKASLSVIEDKPPSLIEEEPSSLIEEEPSSFSSGLDKEEELRRALGNSILNMISHAAAKSKPSLPVNYDLFPVAELIGKIEEFLGDRTIKMDSRDIATKLHLLVYKDLIKKWKSPELLLVFIETNTEAAKHEVAFFVLKHLTKPRKPSLFRRFVSFFFHRK
ncbi:titin homolog [Oryzias melastigma]|uniref:titin homolog n=1 Tax=Oryzias melastigma TaxID=30732 RepID=UPI000CF8243E|nr:titin homolog [Oryzias melastigma]